jgi:hypothetical protein
VLKLEVLPMEEKVERSRYYLEWFAPILFFGSVFMLLCYRFWLADMFWPYPRKVSFFLIGCAASALVVLGTNLSPSTKRWGYLLMGVVLGCWLKP